MAVNRTKVLEAAQKFLSKGQYDKAIAEYQKLVAEDPRDVRTLLKIGDLHTRRNKPKDAIEIYERVAELYAKQGFFLKAVAVYKQILKLDSSHLDSTLKLAQMYEELALANDALNTYEQAADAFLAQGQTDKALETMQHMIGLDAQNVAARIKYAEALSKASRAREAAIAFADGAQLLREQGRIDDYVRVVERQLYHDPENVEIARELAGRYLERSDPKRALAKLQVCFKADPRDIQTLEMLGEAFRQLGQIPKTVSVLKEIARLHAEVNAEEPRRRTLQRVLELDPSDNEARQALTTAPARVARSTQAEPAPAARAAEPSRHSRQSRPAAQESFEDVESFEDAEEEAELTLDDAEEDSDALLVVGDDSVTDTDEGEPSVPGLLAEAEGFESNGDYDRAELALRNALLLEEDNQEVHERLRDVYLAADRRVDAVRELLWLSSAVEGRDLQQAQSFARTAFDLAPRAEATRVRLEALGLDPDTGEPVAADEVVFVEESEADLEAASVQPEPAESPQEPSGVGPAPETTGAVDPLDLPLSPDEFDAAVPRPRPGTRRSDLVSLLERPISADDFDRSVPAYGEAEADTEEAAAPAYAEPADAYAEPADAYAEPADAYAEPADDDMAALLDAPISPDEFDAPPPPRASLEQRRPAYELLDEPVDDFGLSDARFDRSDLHDVGSDPALLARGAARVDGARPRTSLDVVEDEPEPYDDLLSDDLALDTGSAARTLAPIAEQDLAPALDVLERAEPATLAPQRPETFEDSDWSGDLPDPTVPAEPIPELIRRSSEAGLEAVSRGLDTVRPQELVEARDFPHEQDSDDLLEAPLPAAYAAPEAPLPPLTPVPAAPMSWSSTPEPPRPVAPPARAPAAEPARPPEPARATAPSTLGQALTPEIEEALGEAEFFASQGLLDEALEVVQEAILIYPTCVPLKQRLQEYEERADQKELAAAKEEELGLDESFDIAQQLASELSGVPAPSPHDEMVDVESVFAQFKKGVAAQISEDDTDTHFDLGIAYKEMGLTDDAIGEFELSAKSPKRACIAWTMVGMCHLEKGDALKAVSFFERALSQPMKAASEEMALNYEIGNAYELSGQLPKALTAFERVLARDRSFRGVSGRVEQLKRRGVSASASGATG